MFKKCINSIFLWLKFLKSWSRKKLFYQYRLAQSIKDIFQVFDK